MTKPMFQHSFKLDEKQEKIMNDSKEKTRMSIPDFIVIGAHAALEYPEKSRKWAGKK